LELRLAAGIKLFELGRLSSGAAAHLAGIPRVEFLARAASFGVDVLEMDPDALDADLRRA
jgi:predicted HTH domain antitoxin